MRYPILRQKEVAEALWAYRNAVVEEAHTDMRMEAFLSEASDPAVTKRELDALGERFEAASEHAIAAVKSAYDALEIALQATKDRPS